MDWITRRSPAECLDFVRAVSTVMADGRGPLVSELNRLMQEGDLRSVVDCKIDYTKVDDVEDVRAFRSIQVRFQRRLD
jgi:hypothetical protein